MAALLIPDTGTPTMAIILRPISRTAAEDLRCGRLPSDVHSAPDYPTEFSGSISRCAGPGKTQLGPFFLHRSADGVVVGEIGAALVAPNTAEIGYAIVASCWGRGYATDAVGSLTHRLPLSTRPRPRDRAHASRATRQRSRAREDWVCFHR